MSVAIREVKTEILAKRIWLALALFFFAIGSIASFARERPYPSDRANGSGTQSSGQLNGAQAIELGRAGEPPTGISLMPYRYVALQYALAGYRRSKVPLVAFDGTTYLPAGFGDDIGIYYIVPRLAVFSGLSLEKAFDLFEGTILFVSFLTGIVWLFVTLDRWPLKLWAVFALCMLLWFSFRKGDVYVVQSASAVAVVPWFLHLLRKNAAGIGTAAFLFGTGLLIGFVHLIRIHAATGLGIFVVVLIVFELKCGRGRKLALLGVLFAGFVVPIAYFHSLGAQRDAYLTAAQPGYTKVIDHHAVWDTIYLGLGYKKNPYVTGYDNEVSAEKVYSISPSTPYLSPEYDRIIRAETLRIAREHPLFILTTIVAKLRIILFLLLCWCNVGLLASAFYPKSWAMELAFWSALAFNSLIGIVAMPQIQYMLGFMAFATLYGILSLAAAFDPHPSDTFQSRLRSLGHKLRLA